LIQSRYKSGIHVELTLAVDLFLSILVGALFPVCIKS